MVSELLSLSLILCMCFRSLRMRRPSLQCWSTTTTWSTSTKTCKLTHTHMFSFNSSLWFTSELTVILISFFTFPETDLSQTSLWSRVRATHQPVDPSYHFELDTAVKHNQRRRNSTKEEQYLWRQVLCHVCISLCIPFALHFFLSFEV